MPTFELICNYRLPRENKLGQPVLQDDKEFFVFDTSSQSCRGALRKRYEFPKTYCHFLKDNSIQLGYGSISPRQNEEFLKVTIQPQGRIHIERDVRATLPIFYGYSDGIFIASDSYANVASHLPSLTLNKIGIIDCIMPVIGRAPSLWNEIDVLGSNERLVIDSGGTIYKEQTQHRTWQFSHDAPPSEPREFVQRLDKMFENLLHTYHTPNTPLGFQLSGGIDSSTLPLYTTDRHPDIKWHGLTVLCQGLAGVTQAKKLRTVFEKKSNATLEFVTLEDAAAAFVEPFLSAAPQPQYPQSTFTDSAMLPATRGLANKGVSTLFTGVGGDDLFEHTLSPTAPGNISASIPVPAFFTPAFTSLRTERDAAEASKQTLPTISTSCAYLSPDAAQYIENGIWPVHAFLDPDFYQYCQGLPWQFRHQKNILRTYYRTKGFPSILHDQIYPNELPELFFKNVKTSDTYASIIESFARDSIMGDLGLVDIHKLTETYGQIRQGQRLAGSDLNLMSHWLLTELNLRIALYAGQWKTTML